MMTSFDIPDEFKSREQLLQIIASLRSHLAAKGREGQNLSREPSECTPVCPDNIDLQQALQEREALFRIAAEAAKIGAYSRDLQTGEDHWSPEVLAIYGLDPKDVLVLQDKIPLAIHPDDRAAVLAEMQGRLSRTSDPQFNSEHRIIWPNGEIRWVLLQGRLEFDSEKRPLRSHGILMDITDRKQAEESLRKSEDRFHRLFEDDLTGDFICTPEGEILLCNPALAAIFGFASPDDAVGINMRTFHTDPAEWDSILEGLKRQGRLERHEAWRKCRDGRRIYVVENLIGHFSDRGELYEIQGYIFDDTERKQAEEKLRESEERFRVAQELSPDGFTILRPVRDPQGHVADFMWVYENAAIAKLNGTDPAAVVGRRLLDVIPSHADSPFQRVYQEVAESGRPAVLEAPFHGETMAEEKWLRVAVVPSRRDIAILAQDITGRKRVEEALRASDAEMRALFAAMTDLVFIFNSEGRYLKIIDTSPSLLYKPSNELLGKKLQEVFPKEQADFFLSHLRQALDTQQSANFEYSLPIGGKEFWFNATVSPMPDEKTLMVARDITERRQAEEQLRKMNETLEHQVAERTALAEARAKQLQALAVELIEAEEKERGRFAQLLHDDLQQLLAAAKMQVQAVSDGLPHVPALSYARQLIEESISKSRSLSHELSPSVLQYPDFENALIWLSEQMKQKFGLHVLLQTTGEQRIESAPLRRFLFRAAQELLFNVVKHAGVEHVRINCGHSDGWFKVSVIDFGSGFEPGALELSRKSGALGLISIRERAVYFGGKLEIESVPGRGSRFTLAVPLELAQSDAIRKQAASRDIAAHVEVHVAGRPLRVILADDHKVMRQGLTRLISCRPDIQVVGEAANGREAVELARELKPDVVVMDISMPVMDGIEATKMIKSELPLVHTVGLTMHDEDFLRQAMIRAGAEAIVSKAASSSELLQAIYKVHSND